MSTEFKIEHSLSHSFCIGTAKKYHEHIRRTALGKITEDMKIRNKKNLRKERVCIIMYYNILF